MTRRSPGSGPYDQGAFAEPGGARFRVWAPRAQRVEVETWASDERGAGARGGRRGAGERHALEPTGGGYHEGRVAGLAPGDLYAYRLDGGKPMPDPVSRHQPEGVHGPSALVRLEPPRLGSWKGIPRDDLVLYELHVGTFAQDGTFDGVAAELDHLVDLGVTAVEIMPVAQCPGDRNWGYDGVDLFAAQASYGGPLALQRLVGAIHAKGLAAVLDVVYNHFGPEGNYLPFYGPYLTDHHHTPWGSAVNVDDEGCGPVRRYFRDNVRHWLQEFGFDGLRLDAVHTIPDDSPRHILAELTAEARAVAREQGRTIHMVSECSTNDDWMLVPESKGGRGMSATWADDFHHTFDVLVTGQPQRWKKDYRGLPRLATSMRQGFVYRDARVHRFPVGRPQPPRKLVPPGGYVVFSHNHDTLGNRPPFQRWAQAESFTFHRFTAAASILSPHLPLLFMGEEYADPAPFQYFVHHSDPDLVEAVRRGRKREFPWLRDPPDPQAESTFLASRLDPALRTKGPHAAMLAFYREALRLRQETPAFRERDPGSFRVSLQARARRLVVLRRPRRAAKQSRKGAARLQGDVEHALVLQGSPAGRRARLRLGPGRWRLTFDSEDARWGGEGSPAPDTVEGNPLVALSGWHAVVYRREA